MPGATIYSVEGAVWGVLIFGWTSARLSMADSLLDAALTIPAALAGVVNLVACTLSEDSEAIQSSYFNIEFALWMVYASFIVEASSSTELTDTLFGYMAFALVAAALSMSLLTVQLLLSAAAIGPRLWKDLAWMDATVILLTAFHAGLGRGAPKAYGIASTILALNLACLGTLGARMWEISRDEVWEFGVRGAAFFEWLHVGFMLLTGILTVALAYVAKTTQWALITLLCALLTGIILRTVYWARSGGKVEPDRKQPPAASGTLGFPSSQPPPPPQPAAAPPSAPPAAAPTPSAGTAAAATPGLRFNMEPMHGFYPIHARPPAKSKGQ